MKKYFITLMTLSLVFLTLSCGEDKEETKDVTCKTACKDWETCNDKGVCELKAERCNVEADCANHAEGKTACNTETNTCEYPACTDCTDWQVCDKGQCVLAEGRCAADTDCADNTEGKTVCNMTSHVCEAPVVTCDPECKTWETCNEGTCELQTGRCNVEADCADNAEGKTVCNLENNTCEAPATCNVDKTPSEVTLPADSCGELTACTDSSDCADNQRCENLAIEGTDYNAPCCVEGLRGCKQAGEPCENEFDCESGLCIDAGSDTFYCSEQCDEDNNTCPDAIPACSYLWVMTACTPATEE